MKGQHELPEVNCATLVSVKGSEDIFTELFCITPGEYLDIHVNKLLLGQLPIRAVLQKPLVPFLIVVV